MTNKAEKNLIAVAPRSSSRDDSREPKLQELYLILCDVLTSINAHPDCPEPVRRQIAKFSAGIRRAANAKAAGRCEAVMLRIALLQFLYLLSERNQDPRRNVLDDAA